MCPILKHTNILHRLEVVKVDDYICKIYMMPFQNESKRLNRIKKWFRGTHEVTAHQHKAQLCYLNLKMDKILILSDDSSILCDFSEMNLTGINLNRFVFLYKYWISECYDEN